MSPLYPFRFRPIFRRYLWGGRKLGTLLGKPIGEGSDYAESWEIVDRPQDQSVVAEGPLAGMTLHQLVEHAGQDLLGRHHPQPRFPLLFKFLDAQQVLSVQVHPDDARAAKLDPPDLGKTEAWVVLAAEPGSKIYAGLKRGVDRHAFEREVRRGTAELCLHSFEPRVGDCVFIPAGVVHALGNGLVIAEIQQASDVTYRLWDWNRVGPDGKPRPLHIEAGLDAIDFAAGPVDPIRPAPSDREDSQRLVACDRFTLDRLTLDAPTGIGGDNQCHLLAVLGGRLRLAGDPLERRLTAGATLLVPAACGDLLLLPDELSIVLDITIQA